MNEIKKERPLSRRQALPVMVAGLGGLTVLASGCSRSGSYDVEPTRIPRDQVVTATQQAEGQQFFIYEVPGVKAEVKPFRTSVGEFPLYRNPFGSKVRFERSVVMISDPSGVNETTGFAPQTVSVRLFVLKNQNVQEVDVPQTSDTNASLPKADFSVSLANSKGNTNIGEVRSKGTFLKADQVIHPDELNDVDKAKQVYQVDLGLSAPNGGDNVLRVLSGDFNLTIYTKDLRTGFMRTESYLVKQTQEFTLERNPKNKPEYEWYHPVLGVGGLVAWGGFMMWLSGKASNRPVI